MERKREGHAISEAKATLARRKALAFGVLELLQHPQVKLSQVLSNSRIRLLWSRISGATAGAPLLRLMLCFHGGLKAAVVEATRHADYHGTCASVVQCLADRRTG